MISLSKSWAMLSRELYKDNFIQELANFLQKYNVKSILECGCGDGNVLYGLAQRGFQGVGIDGSEEMIKIAQQEHAHSNVMYQHLNWMFLDQIKRKFDCVICRGGSLSSVISWEESPDSFDSQQAQESIEKSIYFMTQKIKRRGILYVDAIRDNEEDFVHIKTENVNVRGIIDYDTQNKIRYVCGGGLIYGNRSYRHTASYLLRLKELEDLIKNQGFNQIWAPQFEHERMYQVICAQK